MLWYSLWFQRKTKEKFHLFCKIVGGAPRFLAGSRRVLPTIGRRISRFCYKSLGETQSETAPVRGACRLAPGTSEIYRKYVKSIRYVTHVYNGRELSALVAKLL